MSFGPELKEGGVESIVGLRRVVPREVSVCMLYVQSHHLPSIFRYCLEYCLQVLHLAGQIWVSQTLAPLLIVMKARAQYNYT